MTTFARVDPPSVVLCRFCDFESVRSRCRFCDFERYGFALAVSSGKW